MNDVRIGQVWRSVKYMGFWKVMSTTAKMATMGRCNSSGARDTLSRVWGFRKATILRDYELITEPPDKVAQIQMGGGGGLCKSGS